MNFRNGKIIIFSGAGISAESGLATFRDGNGLWANYDPNVVCNYHSWHKNYELVHKFYNQRREELARVRPNLAHKIVRDLTREFEVTNITQNVDDLFERANLSVILSEAKNPQKNKIRTECETTPRRHTEPLKKAKYPFWRFANQWQISNLKRIYLKIKSFCFVLLLQKVESP